jgi:hypothetical protein
VPHHLPRQGCNPRGAFLLAALAVGLMTGSTDAGAFTEMGAGLSSCATWMVARRDFQASDDQQWVFGFLSGIGWIGTYDPLNRLDHEAVSVWIDGYCREHILETIFDAGVALVRAHPQ